MPKNTLFSYATDQTDEALFNAQNPIWRWCDRVTIDRYWNGKSSLKEKGLKWKNLTRVRSARNEDTLFFYFQCWFDALNVNPEWSATGPLRGLWEKDVVEVFLKPESCDDYFEIEISPLGQWLDVHVIKPRVDVDFGWRSRLRVKAGIDEKLGIWRAFVALPFQPMIDIGSVARPPQPGHVWRLNLYRMAGEGPDREYLSWRPTFTAVPDFHVPSSFGNLFFLGQPSVL